MPKHNPKLSQPKDRRQKESQRREDDEDPYENKRNRQPLMMALVFVLIIVVVVFLLMNVFNVPGERVQKYDLVKMDFKIYSLAQYENNEEPTFHVIDTWVNACSRYDENCTGEGLIKGFYNELIGKRIGETLNNKFIERCIDNDKNEYDDHSGKAALSYGYTGDTLFDTDIVLWFMVKDYNRTEDNTTTITASTSSLSLKKEELKENGLFLFKYIIILDRKEREI